MTTALHDHPKRDVVAKAQLVATGLLLRQFLLGVAAAMLVLDAGAVAFALSAASKAANNLPHSNLNMGFAPEISTIIAFIAVLMPLFVWADENPVRRAYHWMMPVGRLEHAFSRTLAGWVWLMVGTLVFVASVELTNALLLRIQHLPSPGYEGLARWHYLVPFTTATVFYLFGSAAAVGAEKPIVWIFGIPFLFSGATILATQFGFAAAAAKMGRVLTGSYGVNSVLGQNMRYMRERMLPDGALLSLGSPVARWLGSFALWGSLAIVLLIWATISSSPQAKRRGQ